MFGIGGFELFIILIFGFLIFGPDKLPDIAKTVGKGIARFREAQQDMNETLGAEKIFDPNNPDEPFKDPIEALDKIAQRQEAKRKAKESGKGAPGKDAPAAAAAAGSAKAAAGGKADAATPAQESFTERKARYERERAARKAAEAEAAAEKSDASFDAPASENAGDASNSPVGAHSVRPAAEGVSSPVILSGAPEGRGVEGSRALPVQPDQPDWPAVPAEGGED